MGADLRTLFRILRDHGPPDRAHLARTAAILGAAVARLPLNAVERLWVAARSPSRAPAPVFVVGHWRSGTTHLYTLLSRSAAFTWPGPYAVGLPWNFLLLAPVLRPLLRRLLPEDRYVDGLAVREDSPQEDEIGLASMQDLSFFHAIYFPRDFRRSFREGVLFEGAGEKEVARWERRLRHFVEKLAVERPGARPLIKNPAHTGRVGRLARMYPEARFVHIHRDPWDVFASTRRFYRVLFAELALQDPSGVDVDEAILEGYQSMLGALLSDAAELRPGRFVEVAFTELAARPLAVAERVHRELDLEGLEEARPSMERYVRRVGDYTPRTYRLEEETVRRVAAAVRPFAERWGYAPPSG